MDKDLLDINEAWKRDIIAAFIEGLTSQDKQVAYEKIGYIYSCYAPKYIYKYFGDVPRALDTIINGKLWFSAPCRFNDVFDCDLSINVNSIFDSALKIFPDKRGLRPGSPMWHEIQRTTFKSVSVLKKEFEELKTNVGIACFSEAFDSLLMWSHYANNHSGICVEYNLLDMNRHVSYSPVPVIYSSDRVFIDKISIDTIEYDAMKSLINCTTTKSLEWSYEREWRIIQDNSACGERWDANNKGALLDMIFPHSVIMGCMIQPAFEDSVKRFCEINKINLYKMEKSQSLFELTKKEILCFDED